jgi:predicted aspartyl protease
MTLRTLCASLAMAAMLVPPCAAADATAEAYRAGVAVCMKAGDLACAEKNWQQVLRLQPNDSRAMANLGILMNRRDDHRAAVAMFERAIDLGEGTWDLFSYYADSLEKTGRIDDAIAWSYRTLKVVPTLVDVRGKLAKMLVLQKKYYEALSLLTAFDNGLGAKGHGAYFEAQRMAIESAIERNGNAPSVERSGLRLAAQDSHFFVPVTIGVARPATFLVDTGATVVVMDEALLAESKVAYKVREKKVTFSTADNRRLSGQLLTVSALRLGPYDLKDVPVYACKGCAPLLGQSVLSRFDLKSSKLQGVEFLSLTLR